jgi:hypothetical protein
VFENIARWFGIGTPAAGVPAATPDATPDPLIAVLAQMTGSERGAMVRLMDARIGGLADLVRRQLPQLKARTLGLKLCTGERIALAIGWQKPGQIDVQVWTREAPGVPAVLAWQAPWFRCNDLLKGSAGAQSAELAEAARKALGL